MGVLDVDPGKEAASEDIRLLESEVARLETAVGALGDSGGQAAEDERWLAPDFVDQVLELVRQRETLVQEAGALQEQLAWFSAWGNMSPAVVRKLAGAGIDARFHSFVIGVVHLTLAHLTLAARHLPSPKALGQVGWIAVLWALFFVAGRLVLGRPLPGPTIPLLVAGVLLIVLFRNFQRRIVRGALQTLTDLPLGLISSFSDIVSSSFNDMALDIGFGGPASSLGAALVLLLGHGLNMTLCLMAVIVHGVRLNMLEFSGHLGMQWSGRPYDPFPE